MNGNNARRTNDDKCATRVIATKNSRVSPLGRSVLDWMQSSEVRKGTGVSGIPRYREGALATAKAGEGSQTGRVRQGGPPERTGQDPSDVWGLGKLT
jgi:hypothetical protein